MPYSKIPSATAATAMVGRLRKRPMTSAASAKTKFEIANAPPIGTPKIPARKNKARNDKTDANIQTTVDSQPTGIPRSAARSLRSAAARTAVPRVVFDKNKPTATIANGATIRAMRSLALRMNVPIVNFQSIGGSIRWDAATSPHIFGTSSASTVSNWVIPKVATVKTSRGERTNRRTMANSTIAPRTNAPTRPTPKPKRYGNPLKTMRPTDNVAGTNPKSACEKLSTRLAR